MNTTINRLNILKTIFKKKLYLTILSFSFLIVIGLHFLIEGIAVPAFYNQIINNTLNDAKMVGNHIARHQNVEKSSTVFYTALDRLKNDFNLYKIRLFDTKGKIVFSTETQEIGTLNEKPYYKNVVALGNIYYKLVKKDNKTSDGEIIKQDVIEIYVPIMKDGTFQGSSEIYYDITNTLEDFKTLIQKIDLTFYIISTLFLLSSFFLLYILSKNSLQELEIENNLKQKVDEKTKELKEINKNLETRIQIEVQKNQEHQAQLFQQSKLAALGEMIGNIAHQWRQPLSAISSTASAIQLHNDLNILSKDEINEKMDGIIKKGEFLSNTIENFRNFFKPNQEKTKININKLLTQVETIIDSNYKSETIKVIYETPQNPIIIETLEGELSQVILNILNNSYDQFIQNDTKSRIVKISLKELDDNIIIEIQDSAGGIPDNVLPKIFEPYFTTKHKSQGTGIGLYMCTEIIQKHLNGSIIASNTTLQYNHQEHLGAYFKITLPKT